MTGKQVSSRKEKVKIEKKKKRKMSDVGSYIVSYIKMRRRSRVIDKLINNNNYSILSIIKQS